LSRLLSLAQEPGVAGSWVDDVSERFLRWYGTDGQMRYGGHASFAQLGQLQSALMLHCQQLWQACQLGDDEAIQQHIPVMLTLRQQHEQAVHTLLSGMPQLREDKYSLPL
jgi:hypothetical protein